MRLWPKGAKIPDSGKLRVYAQFPGGRELMTLEGGTLDASRYTCIGAPETGTVSWVGIEDEHGTKLADIQLDSPVAVNAGDTLSVTLSDIKFFPKELMEEPEERWHFKGF